MNRPVVAISLVLLAGFAGLSWRNGQRISELKVERKHMETRISGRTALSASGAGRQRVRDRSGTETGSRAFSLKLIDLNHNLSRLQGRFPEDPALREAMLEVVDELERLNAERLRVVLTEIARDETLDEWQRSRLLDYLLIRLAEDHPQEALELALQLTHESSDARSKALWLWASSDPAAAAAWLENHGRSLPEERLAFLRRQLAAGAFRDDPALAFRLIDEYGLSDDRAPSFIAWDGQTPEEKLAALAALRTWCSSNPDPDARERLMREGLELLVLQKAHEADVRFEHATGWLSGAGLSQEDLEFLFRVDLSYYIDASETGRWIDWFIETFPPDKWSRRVRRLLEDHRTSEAAKAWLESLPPEEAGQVKRHLSAEPG